MLISGDDFISLTMKRNDQIQAFIKADSKKRPWAAL